MKGTSITIPRLVMWLLLIAHLLAVTQQTCLWGLTTFRLGIISITPRYWLTICKSILSFNILISAPNVNHIYSFHKFTYKSWNVYSYLFSNRWNRRSNLRLKQINIYRNLLHFCNDICFSFFLMNAKLISPCINLILFPDYLSDILSSNRLVFRCICCVICLSKYRLFLVLVIVS